MRILLALMFISISSVRGAPPNAAQGKRTDKELILDAVLLDVLNNPELKDTRESYGTQGDKQVALVTNRAYGVPWPANYRPLLPGWTVSRVEEGVERDENSPHLLGVRIDKYFQEDKERAQLFRSPVAVMVLNAGGDKDGIIQGGCSIYYTPKQAGGKWAVEFEALLDP